MLMNHHCSWGTNVPGLRELYLPTNLHPHECIYKHLLIFNKFFRNLLQKKLRPNEPRKLWLPTNIDPHK